MSLQSLFSRINLKPLHLLGLFILVCLFLAGLFSLWFSLGRNKVVAPGSQTVADTRAVVGCDAFDVTDEEIKQFPTMKKLQYGDTGSIPSDFPALPVKTQLCGSLEQLDSVFYITELRDEDLLNYYRVELTKKGYEVSSSHSGTGPNDKVLEVKSQSGFGSIYSFGNKKAFAISFTLYSGT